MLLKLFNFVYYVALILAYISLFRLLFMIVYAHLTLSDLPSLDVLNSR